MMKEDRTFDFPRLFYWFWRWSGFIFVVVMMTGVPATGAAQQRWEITPFRLYDIGGHLSFRYFFDANVQTSDGSDEIFRQSRPVFEEEIFLMTSSYIYHPNFLKLEFGGGPVFAQERFETGEQQFSSSDIFYNLLTRLIFLDAKPHSLILYYDHRNPRIPLGNAERFFRSDTKYGFKFLESLSPIPFTIEGYRHSYKGDGFNQITDERIDHLRAWTDKFDLWKGDAFFSYQFRRRSSASGTTQLPIEEALTTTHTANWSDRQFFGSRRQMRFQNHISFLKRVEFPKQQEIRVRPNFVWQLTDSLIWDSSYQLMMITVEGVDTRSNSVTSQLDHQWYQSLSSKIKAHASKQQQTGQDKNFYGGGGEITYRKEIPFGSLSLYYDGNYDIRDQNSIGTTNQTFGELHILNGLSFSELRHDNVISSSVVVWNAVRTRTFMRDIDYRLVVVGGKTRIQRLLAGSIQDGETVLIDYSFETPGTFKDSIFRRGYGANVNLFSHLDLSAGFHRTSQRLLEGDPTQPLNDIRTQFYRTELKIPIREFMVKGDAEYERRDDNISPFRRTAYSLFLRIPMPFPAILTLNGYRSLIENLKPHEDIDFTEGRLQIDSRPWNMANFSAVVVHQNEVGGTFKQANWSGILRARWRIRRLTLIVEGQYKWRQQADTKQDTTSEFERETINAKIEIRREF